MGEPPIRLEIPARANTAAAEELWDAARTAATAARDVEVDCSATTSIGLAALQILTALEKAVTAGGRSLRIVGASPELAASAALVGFGRLFAS